MKTKLHGFTLIELLIALSIVGIISAIAYPNYSDHIKRSKRAEAQAALVSFANAMETWKMQNGNSYLGAAAGGANTGTPTVFSAVVPVSGGTKTYDLTISAATVSTYTLTAAPVDPSEPSMWVKQDGTKSW
jgi:type IV pilus assembly protein PilE